MSIEKAFAIHSSQEAIFAALTDELQRAADEASGTFDVVRTDPPRSIDLRVAIGGVPCWLTYRLEPRPDHTEVIAVLTPFGLKYTLFRIMTFGLRDQGYEVALVQGLANLKAAVEGGEGEAGDAGSGEDRR
jgi:hypothetical protein